MTLMNEEFGLWSKLNLAGLRDRFLCFVGEAAGSGGDAGGNVSGGDAGSGSSASAGSSPAPGDAGSDSSGAGADSSGGEGFDALFDGLDGDLDSIDLGPQGGATSAPPQPAPGAKEPAATPPKAGEPAAPSPAAAPAATPESQAPSPAPRSAGEELGQAVQDFQQNFAPLCDWAQSNLFALTADETAALETDAVGMIPKLMARTYVQSMMAAANLMRNFNQRMIDEGFAKAATREKVASEAENQFWTAHPHLSKEQHGPAMLKWAKMFRQMNPQASRADAIKFVGNALSTEFGIAPGTQAAPARQVPFAPARPGARQPAPPQPNDPYSGLDEDFLDVE